MLFFFLGYEWIGWRNDTPQLLGHPVELSFDFDGVRNFSAVVIHSSHMPSREVQVSFTLIEEDEEEEE